MEALNFGILTVSDACFCKEEDDVVGPRLQLSIKKTFPNSRFLKNVIPDQIEVIKVALDKWIKSAECDVIFILGGTEFFPRDFTQYPTKTIIEKGTPSTRPKIFENLGLTPKVTLSTVVSNSNGEILVINLPENGKAVVQGFEFIKDSILRTVTLFKKNKQSATKKCVCGSLGAESKVPTTKSKVKLDSKTRRNRGSSYPNLEVGTALDTILRDCRRSLEVEEVELDKILNRVHAEDIYAVDPVPTSLQVGQGIRETDTGKQGSDIAAEELVLHKYNRITPAYTGILATLGKTKVKVFKRASIGILSTGNELKAPTENLNPGQIPDSNNSILYTEGLKCTI